MQHHLLSKFNKWFKEYITPEIWNIGVILDCDIDSILKSNSLDITWIANPYKDRWFADPFILNIDEDCIRLLAEEYVYKQRKGRIAKLTIEKRTLTIIKNELVLDLDTHLSFPIYIEINGKIYMYPENQGQNKVILYKFDDILAKAEKQSVLCDEPLADAVIFRGLESNDGNCFLFATKYPLSAANVLRIYKSNRWDGSYNFYSTFHFQDNIARSAGNCFMCNGRTIRPAQDCTGDYGRGVVLQEVIEENGNFIFKKIKSYYPQSKIWNAGLHTFNVYQNNVAVDGKKYKNAALRNIVKLLWYLFKYWIKYE